MAHRYVFTWPPMRLGHVALSEGVTLPQCGWGDCRPEARARRLATVMAMSCAIGYCHVLPRGGNGPMCRLAIIPIS